MKKIWIILGAVILFIAIGLASYIINHNDNDAEHLKETIAEKTTTPDITSPPKVTATISPENASSLYPANAMVNGEKRYGYIDINGNFVIQPTFMSAGDFYDGAAVTYEYTANEDGTDSQSIYKVIDKKGTVLYESSDMVKDFSNGTAVFYDPNNNYLQGYLDNKGKVMIPSRYMLAEDFNEENKAFVQLEIGKYAVIDKSGTILESYKIDKKYCNSFSIQDGYIIYIDQESNLMGVIQINGEEIFAPNYMDITYLGNDLFGMRTMPSDSDIGIIDTKPMAIYNKNGKLLTDYNYDVSKYYGEYASATDKNYTYFIGLDGKEVSTLPKLEGRGTMKLIGDIIKASIDDELIYMKKDGTILWQTDNTTNLASNITVKSIKYKSNKYVVVHYPFIEGLVDSSIQSSINEKLKQIFTEYRASLKEEDNLTVSDSFNAELRKDLLIIHQTGYDYFFGAAHGMPVRNYYYFNIKTGDKYELGDLFKGGSDYVSKITTIIRSEIEEQMKQGDTMYFPEGFTSISENQYFIINKDSITIYFYPYDIAAYAGGFPEFEIPFADITDLIDKDGAFWNSFK